MQDLPRAAMSGRFDPVAVELMPHLSEEIKRKRIEKLRETLRRKREGECSKVLSNTQSDDGEVADTCAIAGQMMGVGHTYVTMAARLRQSWSVVVHVIVHRPFPRQFIILCRCRYVSICLEPAVSAVDPVYRLARITVEDDRLRGGGNSERRMPLAID